MNDPENDLSFRSFLRDVRRSLRRNREELRIAAYFLRTILEPTLIIVVAMSITEHLQLPLWLSWLAVPLAGLSFAYNAWRVTRLIGG